MDEMKTLTIGNKTFETVDAAARSDIAAAEADLAVQTARIDEIASLPEGSTSGDAELADIRVGYNGVSYPNAGDAVRGQISAIYSGTQDITNDLVWSSGHAVLTNGNLTASTNFKASDYVELNNVSEIYITVPIYTPSAGTQALYGLMFYDSEKVFKAKGYQLELGANANKNITIPVPEGAKYFRTTYFKDDYSSYVHNVDFTCQLSTVGLNTLFDDVSDLSQDVSDLSQEINCYHVHLGQEEINRFYGLKEDGLFDATIFGVTSFIDCKGVKEINVKMPILSESVQNLVGLVFYDSNKTKISFVASNRGSSNSAEIRTISVSEGAYYFRCCYWNFDNKDLYGGDWVCDFYTDEYSKYRPYQDGYIFFSPEVNQAVNQYWETDFDTELGLNLKDTNSVLLLPTNYDPDGKPVPVIMYFHGFSHYVYYNNWGADADFRTQKAQWAAQGFAVIDCNGARTNNKQGHFTSGGALQYSDGYHKTFEYVKEHYNVEQYCHVICASAGGIPGINYACWFNDAKSLLMLSAWTSLKANSYGTGQTASMIEYLGCDFSDGYDATADKTIGFDPILRIFEIDGTKYAPALKIPAKAMLGSTESGNHIWNALQTFVGALRNAGQSVSLRIVDGATHKDICSSASEYLNTEYANWCKSV